MKRLFIAVPVHPEKRLLDLIQNLKAGLRNEPVNWVSPENLHFTLHFLGDTKENQVDAISGELATACQKFSKMTGTLKGLAYFSQNGMPRVIYTELKGMREMAELADEIRKTMEPFGFRPDHKNFTAHLTLGRIKFLRNKTHFTSIMEAYRDMDIQNITASEVVLFESLLRPEGPVYRKISAFPL